MNSDGTSRDALEPIEDFNAVGLVSYLSEDTRPTFVVEHVSSASGLRKDHASFGLTFVNPELSRNHASIHELLLADMQFSTPTAGPPRCVEATAWLAWIRSARHGSSFQHEDILWHITIIHNRWRVFSGTATQPAKSSSLVITSQPARNIFDIAFESGCITLAHYQHLQAVDWKTTEFGTLDTWSTELREAVKLALAIPEPYALYWGPSRSILYNDAFTLVIGDMHPAVLGKSAPTHMQFAWDPIEVLVRNVEKTGRSTGARDFVTVLTRSGQVPEECFFTFWFYPAKDPTGRVLGVYNQPVELTEQILSQRRMSNLLKIGEVASSAVSLDLFWRAVLSSFDFKASEVPLAAIYSRKPQAGSRDRLDRGADILTLEGSTALFQNAVRLPDTIDLALDSPLTRTLRGAVEAVDTPLLVTKHLLGFHIIDDSYFTDDSKTIVCPLQVSSMQGAAYVIICLQDLRPYTEAYKSFINLLMKQIEAGATSLVVLAEEKRRLERTVEQANLEAQRLFEELEIQKREAAESAWRFLQFAKHAPVGVYTFGTKGEILFANDVWFDMFCLPRKSNGEQIWRKSAHPEDLHLLDEKWRLLTEHGTSHANFEFRVRKLPDQKWATSGDYRVLSSSCFAELDQQGSFKSVTGVIIDNTLDRAHEREVAERLASALEAKRAQENFMDMVSHEMRNPLNAIIQCAEEAAEVTEPYTLTANSSPMSVEKARVSLDAINTILYCGHHQKQIIDDVLTISKLDSNLLTLAPTDSDPLSVARQALQIHGSEIRASDITVSMAESQGATQTVMMDAGRVLQVLMNLVGNAIKFLKGRPVRKLNINVSISTDRPKPEVISYARTGQRRGDSTNLPVSPEKTVYIQYSIEDTGPGMTREETNMLFGRFKQGSPRTHAQYGGSGLGLFICRELTELHGGEIGLKSAPEVGSTFAFYIRGCVSSLNQEQQSLPTAAQAEKQIKAHTSNTPATSAAQSGPAAKNEVPQPSDPGSAITVMIVEDNIINQNVLNRQLKRVGFSTVTADHGEQALEQLRKSTLWLANHGVTTADADLIPVSAVLCDLEMPVMDGLTCVKHVRQMQRDGLLGKFPMIAVTGNARAEQVQVARDAGFDDVVCKPYSMATLVPLIKELVSKFAAEAE